MEELKNSEVTHENMFTRASVLAEESKVRLVDSDEETGLELFCYIHCDNNETDFIKQCRGLVFHGNELVMKAFSYTDEFVHTDDSLSASISSLDNWKFYTSYEGALLRLFYFSGRWFLSTHRKLNAFRSKWASRDSFGTLFKKALEHESEINPLFADRLGEGDNILVRFQNSLDKGKQYMFLLRNCSDNRIVCDPPEPSESLVFHVGTFVNGQLRMDEPSGLPTPEHHTFKTVTELTDHVASQNPKRLQGVMCFGPNNRQLKVLHTSYFDMFQTRGNEPSIKFRYLQVRMNTKMTEMLFSLYPELKPVFDDYENTLYDIARSIYRAYVQRFIKKRYVTVPREEYQVVSECHAWHLSDRENNRITLDKVIQILNKQPPTNVNHMIRRFKIEQAKKQETLPRSVRSRNNSAVNSPAFTGIAEQSMLRPTPPQPLE